MSWKKGPMPENTFNWGGVVPVENRHTFGFYFADFMGDHVVLCPSGKILKAHEIAYYNNSIDLPPRKVEVTKGVKGEFAEDVKGQRLS